MQGGPYYHKFVIQWGMQMPPPTWIPPVQNVQGEETMEVPGPSTAAAVRRWGSVSCQGASGEAAAEEKEMRAHHRIENPPPERMEMNATIGDGGAGDAIHKSQAWWAAHNANRGTAGFAKNRLINFLLLPKKGQSASNT
uniref:Uncharacterized protein n=1 Tax=Romanomermis culicivorax TaxID=13658 RepID=A0A915HNC3_ROMCU